MSTGFHVQKKKRGNQVVGLRDAFCVLSHLALPIPVWFPWYLWGGIRQVLGIWGACPPSSCDTERTKRVQKGENLSIGFKLFFKIHTKFWRNLITFDKTFWNKNRERIHLKIKPESTPLCTFPSLFLPSAGHQVHALSWFHSMNAVSCHLFLLQRVSKKTSQSGEKWPFKEYEIYLLLHVFALLNSDNWNIWPWVFRKPTEY